MSEFDLPESPVWDRGDPTCRLVWARPHRPWHPWPRGWYDVRLDCHEIAGAGVWNLQERAYAMVRPFGTAATRVRDVFTQSVAEGIAGALWPAPAGEIRPDSGGGPLTPTQGVLTLDDQLMGATAQVAALQAGFSPGVALKIGQAAQQLYAAVPAAEQRRPFVQYLDFTFSAAPGSRTGSSGLKVIPRARIATVINDLLGPEGIAQRGLPRNPFTPLDGPGGGFTPLDGPGGGLGPG
jgi:hypothetical protein